MLGWEEFPKVDVAFMNDDHQECLQMLDELEVVLKREVDDQLIAEINRKLTELEHHLKAHFAREEQAMEESGFPPYYVHKTEHESVLQQWQQAVSSWHKNQDLNALQRFICVSFVNWLETHAITMDTVTAQHVARHGAFQN